jgi:hypothetical protein
VHVRADVARRLEPDQQPLNLVLVVRVQQQVRALSRARRCGIQKPCDLVVADQLRFEEDSCHHASPAGGMLTAGSAKDYADLAFSGLHWHSHQCELKNNSRAICRTRLRRQVKGGLR